MHQEIEGSGEPGVPGTCGKAQGNSGDTKCLPEAQEPLGGWGMVLASSSRGAGPCEESTLWDRASPSHVGV